MRHPVLQTARPRVTVAALLATLSLLLAACGSTDAGSTSSASASTQSTPATSQSPSSESATFPVTVKAANGAVTIAAQPERVVSLSATATEMLFALGAGPQVKAVDDQSTYPKAAPRTSLSGFKPNIEAIAKYDPDLVVVSDDTGGLVTALGKLKIPVLREPAARTVRDSYAQVEQLGVATGHVAEAAAVVATMQRGLADVVRTTPKRPGVRIYHELDQTGYSANSRTFIGSIYRLFGVPNIADAAPKAAGDYPQLSAEYVVSADPDLIFLADTKCCQQTPATVAKRPGWSKIQAVRDGGVVALDDDVASRWGPRIVQLAERIGAAVAEQPARASAAS